MQRKLFSTLFLFFTAIGGLFAQSNSGTLMGKTIDKDTKEPLPFVTVLVALNGNTVNGGTTDIDGNYSIKPLDPGVYDVTFQFVGYNAVTIKGVIVKSGKITDLNSDLVSSSTLGVVEVFDYKVPLIDKDGGSSGGTITREELKNMPSRSVTGIATTVAGATDTGDGVSIRGARTGSTWYYIDGVKMRGSSALPKSALEEISVITGGIPANIGDATGGVINVSLRSASAEYTGGVELITSGFPSGETAKGLDRFGYNLIEGSVSGPLLMKKNEKGEKERSLLGFFVSGNVTDIMDDDPQYGGLYKIRQSALDNVYSNPVGPNVDENGQVNGVLFNADFLTPDDFYKTPTRQNVRSQALNMVTKIDVNLSENMTLTLGGTVAYRKGRDFNDVVDGNRSNSLMNWQNNELQTDFDWRTYVKFSQRFKNAEGEEAKSSNLRNIYYSVMLDQTRTFERRQDETHGSDLFKYGHVGYFDIIQGNTYEQTPGSFYRQTGFQDITSFYTPSEFNPDLASINTAFYNGVNSAGFNFGANAVIYDANGNLIRDRNQIFLSDPNQILGLSFNPIANLNNLTAANGLRNGDNAPETYNLWNYPGTQSNRYRVISNNQFRISGMGSADIGKHAVQIGFEYEQRKDAAYSVSPVGLWQLARQTANSHLEKIDRSLGADSTMVFRDGYYFVYYNTAIGQTNQAEFDYNLREALGLDPNGGDYINVDNLSPEFLSINMFNADELFNSGNEYINYYGYDTRGNKLTGRKPTIDDFFTKTHTVGGITYFDRAIGAYEPIYTSGYIMDKFAFNDLIFNVGLRIDRYDANQPVLKDPFVVNQAFTAVEVKDLGAHPSNIGDDFVVYVDNENNPTAITGYRDGDRWYLANGQEVTDPSLIGGSGNPLPYLKVNKDEPLSSGAFKDYTPAVNIMPRIQFSFPISDEAVFYAHYDVLTQRPTEFARFDPINYLNMRFQNNPLITNPALKPERTVDYALGFQQVLTKTSSIKLEAFYRELRNMVQLRKFNGAYPIAYRAFDNIDFGTVKGLTLTYDLRRTGNVSLKASYTLQFADGTGSTSQSQSALINAGVPNLRSINPFDYDQRHRFIINTDYRFAGGSAYNGPMVKDFQVLANTGFNFIANLGSGMPYTPQQFATPVTGEVTPSTEGSINGARKPWQFTLDFNADRNIPLSFGKDGDKKKTYNLNVYFWITNLLNTRNVTSVYRFTGVSDDDGYLAAAQAQQFINQQNDPASFRNYYTMFINNPNNLGQPRQIRLGVRLDF